MLLGRISDSLLFSLQDDAVLTSMALEVIKSSEIEGEILNLNQLRSSLAKRPGFDITTSVPVSRFIDGVVDPSQKCLWGTLGAQVIDRRGRLLLSEFGKE